ncbi:MAG: hypothetical protein K2R98_28940 [Gemmataceae bacterium]|nr:hypothetical protein [Gemmataceae bacterium]
MRSIWLFVFSVLSVPLWFNSSSAADPTYWQDIRPVMRKHCTACHNEKNLKEVEVSGGLALDTFEPFKPGGKKPVVLAGKGATSPLVKVLLHKDDNRRMPQGAPALSEQTIALIQRWIDAGAKEGERPVVETTPVGPVRTRKLDVVLSTNAIPPKDVLGPGNPAKLDLALKVGPLAPVAAVTFSPDGKLLATGTYGLVTLWDLESAKPVKTLTSVLGAVHDLKFSPDGKVLAVAGGQPSAKGDLRLFNVADWTLIASLGGHADVVSSVAFTSDGKRLASASFDKTVRVWDVTSHKLEQTLTGHSDFVYAVAFSPDGQWLASASKDRSVKKVETATGKSLLTFSGMDQEVLAVAVSPDGQQVVCAGADPVLTYFNAQTGQRIRRQGGHGIAIYELCFSKDGQTFVSAGGDRLLRTWNTKDGTLAKTFPVSSIAYATAISPNGKLVVSGSFDGLVRVFDIGTTRHLLTLLSVPPHDDKHDWLALTPEGYAASSDSVASAGQWRMGVQAVNAEAAWKALRQPESVAKAARGEALAPPFGAKQ